MTLALRWTKAARRDLLAIGRWRGREHAELGDKVLDQIEAACGRLQRFPYLGPAMPRIAPGARKLSVDGYLALYKIDEAAVTIVRVVDQRMLLEAIKFDESDAP